MIFGLFEGESAESLNVGNFLKKDRLSLVGLSFFMFLLYLENFLLIGKMFFL
jgi:hypothetical protein